MGGDRQTERVRVRERGSGYVHHLHGQAATRHKRYLPRKWEREREKEEQR
jgi:hypothetical protein